MEAMETLPDAEAEVAVPNKVSKNETLKSIEEFIACSEDIGQKVKDDNENISNVCKEINEIEPKEANNIISTKESDEVVEKDESIASTSSCVQPSLKRPLRKKGKMVRKKLKMNVEPEVENILEDMKEDIDTVLEKTAQKNKLTPRNVRSILRHVITNEHVLAMVWNTMHSEAEGGGNLEVPEAFFEPKLTRSKIRQLKGQVSDTKENEGESSQKSHQTESTKLLVDDFPENESDDDDFEPAGDVEEESEDEYLNTSAALSDLSSPQVHKQPVTNEQESGSAQSEDETRLVIVSEELEKIEEDSQMLFSPELSTDKISLRTRSKLPLDDTPLESIEAAFIAPDITTDMYDSDYDCDDDDWKNFLSDFFKPLPNMEPNVEDEINDDPEYNFIEDDVEATDQWDLRSDRAVKVSKKELNELIAELLETAEQYVEGEEDDDDDTSSPSKAPDVLNLKSPSSQEEDEKTDLGPESIFLTPEMRAKLDEQMRMHVQLLTQSFVLTHADPNLKGHTDSCRTLIMELDQFSKKEFLDPNYTSAFAAHNLPEAVKIVTKLTNEPIKYVQCGLKSEKTTDRLIIRKIPKKLQDIIASSKVFMYPQLLPSIMMNPKIQPSKLKIHFFPCEDMLIAYGLEEFSHIEGLKLSVSQLIHSHLVPNKTEGNIKLRIKNRKSKPIENNPIAYYFKYGKAPVVPFPTPVFDPKAVLAPKDNKSYTANMPFWVVSHFIRTYRVPISPAIPIASVSPKSKPSPFLTPKKRSDPARSLTPARSLPQLLPKSPLKSSSPMKQISSILRKYGMRNNRAVIRGQLNFLSPVKKCAESSVWGYRSLLPKPFEIQDPIVSSSTSLASQPIIVDGSKNITVTKVNSSDKTDSPSPDALPLVPDEVGNEAGSQSEADTCEEGDDNEDENVDNELDLAALMEASSTICKKSPIALNVKKKKKHEKELESTLPLLALDLVESDPLREARETAFANAYFQKVKETLSEDAETFETFLSTMHDFQSNNKSPVELYHDINKMFVNYPALIKDFVAFLLPEQARECDRLEDHNMFMKSQLFLRKLEVQFSQQPQQLQKVLKILKHLETQNELTGDVLHAALNPFLRGRSHLLEEFNLLLPDEPPPESLMTDFEDFKLPDSDSEMLDEDDDGIEEIFVPESEDPYGGRECPCFCHINTPDLRMLHRSKHCVKCGLRFIDGHVYLHTQAGKAMKPAQIICHSKMKLSDYFKDDNDKDAIDYDKPVPNISISKPDVIVPNCDEPVNLEPTGAELEVNDIFKIESDSYVKTSDSPKWSKEEDAVLLKTCQKLHVSEGLSETAFEEVAKTLKNRTLESVKNRFKELLNLFLAHKNDDEMETETDDESS